ncbi:hypothetical protein FIA58_002640 [Flavobacterium jejuense]|uniref:Uncharacterized protein n=1 Tax=Flavobacterium jejuense TaxID=1544455 RepID=A0ABX0IL73_9FLAO|nr:hypothetical protein [Flavobacterium jejuense]NHN24562.1 hypothetical protein [Flavobacterium jejuense]
METPNDDANLDKYTKDRIEKGIQELLDEKELKIKWRKEIEQNEAIQAYFKGYQESSISSFINDYLQKKYMWFRFGDMYKKMADDHRSQWIELAHDHLEIILQKKLFDLQCLWRAEQIKVEGVEICFDFVIWQNDILNCPFLEPLTASDIEMYQEYLLSEEAELIDYCSGDEWQDYEERKAGYLNPEGDYLEMPEWYEFHNQRTGNTNLFLLPDIRGEKENFYSDLYFKNKEKEKEKKEQPVNTPTDYKPSLVGYDHEVVSFFVKTFETKDIQSKYKHYEESNSIQDNMYYEDLIREMIEAKENIPIRANEDFREALVLAHNEYRCKKVADHLPLAFEQYLFNIKMGFSVGGEDLFYTGLRDNYLQRLIEGRVLNGEEPNLDF